MHPSKRINIGVTTHASPLDDPPAGGRRDDDHDEDSRSDPIATTAPTSRRGVLVRLPVKWIVDWEKDHASAMFSLFYGLWKHVFTKTEFHVLILGVHKSGKTTLLEKLKSIYLKGEGLPRDRIVPTVGLNIGRIEDANVKLVFWDLGGQVGLRTIWEKYYEEAHAIIYVIDAAAASSFEDAKFALEKVLRHEDLRGAPLLIFANKKDLPAAVTEEELARYLHLEELDERPCMFQAGSAYDGTGIKSGINWLVEEMERSKRTKELRSRAGAEAVGQI